MNKILLKTFSDEKLDEIIKCGFEEFEIDKKLAIIKKVFIKPNLSVDEPLLISGANTDVRIIKGVLRYLSQYQDLEVVVGESESFGRNVEKAMNRMSLMELEKEFKVKVKNLTKEQRVKILIPEGRFLKEVFLSRSVAEADLIINLPKIKTHRYTTITCALKNMFGSIPSPLRIRYHENIHQTIADLNTVFKNKIFIVTDGIMGMEGEGPLIGRKLSLNLLLFADNQTINDIAAAKIMKISLTDILHINLANIRERINLSEVDIIGDLSLADASRPFERPIQNWLTKAECRAVRFTFIGRLLLDVLARSFWYLYKKYRAIKNSII